MEQFISAEQINALFGHSPLTASLVGLSVLLLIAIISNFIVKRVLLRSVLRALRTIKSVKDQDIIGQGVISRLSNAVPALFVMMGVKLIPNLPLVLVVVIQNVVSAFIVLTLALALAASLDVINTIYSRSPNAHNKPIKGYLQVLKIVIYLVATILVIATLIDKSPLILLSGLGAMAAVLMLVFQDTLLSLVASVQISSSDMVRVGDWIEMPNLNADGDVIDIALHTVRVQNWDKTITTLPTRRLITDPFKNWRGMQESGGRRIKRPLYLDQTSIHFLTDDEKNALKKFVLLSDYIEGKEQELKDWNNQLGRASEEPVNMRRMTNVGTFRAYIKSYLEHHQGINNNMTQLARQLSPSATGLPIEIYCFTNTVAWATYENIQSDIFDHLYAILPEFGLRAYQQPSGFDLQKITMNRAVISST